MRKYIIMTMAVMGLAVGFSPVTAISAFAKSDPVYTSLRNNVAVGGYDAMSFHQGKPLKGTALFSTRWNGAQWHFSSQVNLESFLADPERYAPAYGGYCAWALAKGKLAKGSPKQWKIHNERLYLNYNAKIKTRWLADIDNYIAKADQQWPEILE